MRKARPIPVDGEMVPEYDFRGAVRGKYAHRFEAGTNIVVLDPNVAEVFCDSVSVNEALRALARVAALKKRRRPGTSAASRCR